MAQYSHLPLYAKTYEFVKHTHLTVKQFRKEHKYTLGQDINRLIWQVLDGVMSANSLPPAERTHCLDRVSLTFERFKIRIRLSYEIGLISQQKFAFIQNEAASIGRMIGGWQKWAKREAGKVIPLR